MLEQLSPYSLVEIEEKPFTIRMKKIIPANIKQTKNIKLIEI